MGNEPCTLHCSLLICMASELRGSKSRPDPQVRAERSEFVLQFGMEWNSLRPAPLFGFVLDLARNENTVHPGRARTRVHQVDHPLHASLKFRERHERTDA